MERNTDAKAIDNQQYTPPATLAVESLWDRVFSHLDPEGEAAMADYCKGIITGYAYILALQNGFGAAD